MKFTAVTAALVFTGLLVVTPIDAGWRGGPGQSGSSLQEKEALSQQEADTLRFMREEEKMARDVYRTLFTLWEHPVFDNISQSEQRHMNAMKRMLDQYGIEDPVIDDETGVFMNEQLGQMYDDLVTRGEQSLEEALRAGALIEEVDILDLQNAIAESTHSDLVQAYENLMRGSRNHLRAFVGQLENMGIVYEAVEMDQSQLDEIVDSPMERGGRKAKRKGCKGRGCRF